MNIVTKKEGSTWSYKLNGAYFGKGYESRFDAFIAAVELHGKIRG